MVGIPTISITIFPEETRQAGPPRAFHPENFKPGNSLGGPYQVELQHKVLRDALRRWEAREEPGHLWQQAYPEYSSDDSWRKAYSEE